METKSIRVDVQVNAVIEQHRVSFCESENSILRRIMKLAPVADRVLAKGASAPIVKDASEGVTRQRGDWHFKVGVETGAAPNMIAAYKALLLAAHRQNPNVLTQLADRKTRGRRVIAKTPDALFLSTPTLAEEFAKPLAEGWFYDTNLSNEQVKSRVRMVAEVGNFAADEASVWNEA